MCVSVLTIGFIVSGKNKRVFICSFYIPDIPPYIVYFGGSILTFNRFHEIY